MKLLLASLLVFSFSAMANSISISPSLKEQRLGEELLYQADSNGTINIKTLLKGEHQDNWQVSRQKLLNFGLTDKPYWVKFELSNQSIADFSALLEMGYSLMNTLDIYLVENNLLVKQYNLGTERPFSNKPFPANAFVIPIEIPSGRNITVYIRAENSGFMQLPLTLWELNCYVSSELGHKVVIGMLTGIFLLMASYSLFLFAMLRETRFLYYLTFCSCFVFAFWSLKGYAGLYLLPRQFIWHDQLLVVSVGVLCLILSLFGEGLKRFRKNKIISTMNKGLVIACVALVASPFVLDYQHALYFLGAVVMLMTFVSIIEASYYWIRGNYLAQLFATSWVLFILGMCLLMLNRFAVIPRNPVTEQFVAVSAFVGLLLLTIALANRTSEEKKAKKEAEKEASVSIERYFDIFNNATEGLFTSTLSGEVLSANKALCASFKYKGFEDLRDNYGGNMGRFYHGGNSREQLVAEMLEKDGVINREIKSVRSDGTVFWALLNLRLSQFYHGKERIIDGSLVDISQRKKQELRLRYMAQHDQLTGLFNRRKFEDCVTDIINNQTTGHGRNIIFYLDLDQFKVVNDTCGHSAGDKLLQSLTRLLVAEIPNDQILARLGGDEFGIMLTNTFVNEAIELAERLRRIVQDYRFVWGDRVFTLGISIGIVAIEDNMQSFAEVLSLVDTACYTAKEQGRNRIYFYSENNSVVSKYHREMKWVSTLNDALEQNRFELAFQPIKSLGASTEKEHYEVLIRLRSDTGELIAPGEFLPAAETYNLMPHIDKWVVENFCKWLKENPDDYDALELASINLCGQSLADRDVKQYILECFARYQIDARKICFEITEGQAIREISRTLSFMDAFKELGCSFSLDDFGVGFCSYSYLKQLPIDYLKIDGSFVRDILVDATDFAMVRSFSELANAVGVKTVAEFVETKEIEAKLISIGIDYVQGYGIAKPMLLSEKKPQR